MWPRGIAKDKAKIDLWLKDVAPSNELRKRFGMPRRGLGHCRDDRVNLLLSELREDGLRAP